MKSCSSTSIILNLLALSATTRAVGNFQIDYASCGATGTAFIQKEYALVLQSAVYMNTNLNAPSQTTNTLVGYMFGTAQRGYDPISFPQVVFGGGGTNNILGLANFATAQTPAGLGDGDFKIFCNIDHFIPPDVFDGETDWYDPYSGTYTYDSNGLVQACSDGNPTPLGSPPPNAIRAGGDIGTGVTSISFCGWYMARAMAALFPDGSTFNGNFYSRMAAWWATRQPLASRAEIDVFKLFDGTFMHELIHTPAAGFKHDVLGKASQGWNGARALSTNTDPITGCQANVDNFQELSLANRASFYYIVAADGSLTLRTRPGSAT